MQKTKLSHFDTSGQARMIDVSAKAETHRLARAKGFIHMQPTTLARVKDGDTKKGDVLAVARIAGIQGAKRTAELIPLCHSLNLTKLEITFSIDEVKSGVYCTATAQSVGRTGVEMEALTAVMTGLLTIYDMCKAMDRGMRISDVHLDEKRGGESGDWTASGVI